MKKAGVEKIERMIHDLEHDKKLGLSVLEKTRQILDSKASLWAKKEKIKDLKKLSDKKRKIQFDKYLDMMKKVQEGLKKLVKTDAKTKRLQHRFDELKKFFK